MTIINQHLSTTPKDERDLASTPWDLVSRLALVMNYTFVLDVCALPMSKRAPFFYGERDFNDGSQVGVDMFEEDWYATVDQCRKYLDLGLTTPAAFMNPPFSCFSEAFEKAVIESRKGLSIATVCMHSENTEWWKNYVRKYATFIVKPAKRTQFEKPDGSPFMSVDKKTGKLKVSSVGFYSVCPIFTPIQLPGGPVEIFL